MAQLSTLPPKEHDTPEKPLYYRMENEPLLWYNRFKRFRYLGPKRTVLAALQQERSEIKALKSTPDDATKKTQVPGSWKKACLEWRWVERALAYDASWIERAVETRMLDLTSGMAVGIERVGMLKKLYDDLLGTYHNAAKKDALTYELQMAYVTRMQSVLRDIKDEMSSYNEAVTRTLITQDACRVYMAATPDEIKSGRIVEKKK